MGRNLVGYFSARPDCEQYSVKIITDSANTTFDEIQLAGSEPFVVTYEKSNSPFGDVRYSTAAINCVADEYFLDVVGEEAQSTQVILTNEDTHVIEWVGFLTSNLINMPFDSCGAETFTIQAEDCLSSLKHYNYEKIDTSYKIATFNELLGNLMKRCSLIKHLFVDMSMKDDEGQWIMTDKLKISEKNFFSSDTEEPWKANEVLEEICRYLGHTAIQIRDRVFLFDYQAHADSTFDEDELESNFQWMNTNYADGFNYITVMTYNALNRNIVLNEDRYMGTGSDISLETIYNKVYVKDSFYEIPELIPDFFEDKKLKNTRGEFWFCEKQSTPSNNNTYINEKNATEYDKNEIYYDMYMRTFLHDNYINTYRNQYGTITTPLPFSCKVINHNREGGVLTFQVEVNNLTSAATDFNVSVWKNDSLLDNDNETIEAYNTHVYEFIINETGTITYRVNGHGPYNASQENYTVGSLTRDYMGATIVDIANSHNVPLNDGVTPYNYEVDNSLNFDRYICISQKDKPQDLAANPRVTSLTMGQKLQAYFPVLSLQSGYTNPLICDENAFISINGSAIFERYTNKDYINPQWTEQCSGIDKEYNISVWGVISGEQEIWTSPPALVFLLKIGDYYWNGTQWTSTKSLFWVDLHTPTTDSGYIDYSAWWNKEHKIINNVSWEDWAGIEGYKIPLTGVTFNWNKPIQFEIRIPSKMQVYHGNKTHSGMNSYCWLKDFEIKFGTKMSENYDNGDIVYENVIESGSVNELKDITCKITTYPDKGMHSYSNTGYKNALLKGMIKIGLDDEFSKPEENILKSYYNQYSTPTVTQTMTLDMSATQLSRVKDPYLGKYFIPLGADIDYAAGSQRITLTESKTYNE